jgi:5'-3' exonuclease
MDNTQNIFYALEQRLAAQDTRNTKMEEMMCNFMEKTLRMVQNGPTADHRAVGSEDTSPLPSQQSHQRSTYEDVNFRHQRVEKDFFQETTFRDTPDSYFKKRLSSLQSIAED